MRLPKGGQNGTRATPTQTPTEAPAGRQGVVPAERLDGARHEIERKPVAGSPPDARGIRQTPVPTEGRASRLDRPPFAVADPALILRRVIQNGAAPDTAQAERSRTPPPPTRSTASPCAPAITCARRVRPARLPPVPCPVYFARASPQDTACSASPTANRSVISVDNSSR